MTFYFHISKKTCTFALSNSVIDNVYLTRNYEKKNRF